MDRSMLDEGPETPAHVFAIRAFKTALFGTPAPPPQRLDKPVAAKPAQTKHNETNNGDLEPELLAPQSNTGVSPTKSILVTPGAAADPARRKTVSFSALRHELKPADISGSTEGSPEIELKDHADVQEKSGPRRSLFQSRSEQSKATAADSTNCVEDNAFGAPRDFSWAIDGTDGHDCGDVTMDLKLPQSQSGKHWKREYQKEHDKSKAEMQKLIRYSQIAKSYAIKRDDEAVRMREKLLESEAKMQEMEKQVAQLAGELGVAKTGGENQAGLLDELAKQTAQALRYKQKAEKYQAALEEEERLRSTKTFSNGSNQSRRNEASLASAISAENEALSRQAATLEEENVRLKRTIARYEEEKRRYDERHRIWLQERRRKDERANTKKKALQDQLAKLKADNNRLAHELQQGKDPSAQSRYMRPEVQEPRRDQLSLQHRSRTGPQDTLPKNMRAETVQNGGDKKKYPGFDITEGSPPQSRARNSKTATAQRSDDVEQLRKDLHEKLSGGVSRPGEESLDLCNLPNPGVRTRPMVKSRGSAAVEDGLGNKTTDSKPRSIHISAKPKSKRHQEPPNLRQAQVKAQRGDGGLADRVLSARADLAAILAEKERARGESDEGKENVKPLSAM